MNPRPRQQKPEPSFWKSFLDGEPAEADGSASFWRSFLDGEPSEPDPSPSSATHFDPSKVYWAMNNLPAREGTKHFLVTGTVGSGKTKTIQLFLQSIAPRFLAGHGPPEQLIVFDAKGDMIPRLAKLGLRPDDENVWILHPFDERAASWNLGEAIKTPAMARYLAALFIGNEPNSTAPYFPNTAREIVFWVALSLSHRRRKRGWTLRDLLNALESKDHIAAVTSHLPRAKRVIAQHLTDRRHFPGVLSTMATKLGRFEEVAALWATGKSGRSFSVTDFLKKKGVLILGHDPVLAESIWPMNSIILQAITNEILREGETKAPRHWFVLDEFRAMGQVNCIRDLLNLGRSKGASVMLGIQSVEGLVEIYGQHAADEMLGLCSTKTFLRAGGPSTAEWAERHFNRVREVERTVSETFSHEYSRSVSYQVQERSLFLPAMFLDLAMPQPGGLYEAISDIPCLRTTLITKRPFDNVLAQCNEPTDEEIGAQSAFIRTDPDEQIIEPWNPNEETDFCDVVPVDPPPTPEPPKIITREAQQERRRKTKDS